MQPKHSRGRSLELLWPKVVLRKWLNLDSKSSEYCPDSDIDGFDEDDADSDISDVEDSLPRLRRRNSETFRAQYINTKDIRVCVGTWNVGGKLPSDDIDIEEWLNINEPADIYVLGLQEIVPLNPGNIFGPEDTRRALKWENVIQETFGRVQRLKSYKSYSDPPTPSKFKPSDDLPDLEDEISLFDSDGEEEVHPVDDESPGFYEATDRMACSNGLYEDDTVSNGSEFGYPDTDGEKNLKKQFSSPRRLNRLQCFQSGLRDEDDQTTNNQVAAKLHKTLSGTERIGLSWPEPPLNLLAQHVLQRSYSFKSAKSFKMSKSFRTYGSFKIIDNQRTISNATALAELDLESLIKRKRRPEYVRIVSKQMIGIFLTVWVRKGLRKHIQNLKVSTVGVGVMGYIGNKGSVSISMSIYQTLFCFICTHLTSGEKEENQLKRNADVNEIHRRTLFHPDSGLRLPKSIYDHERIIWLGDLNYRINLSYDETWKLISKKDWSKLVEKDQLVRELKKGRVFDGWCEGELNFPPTYKYEMNSDQYCGQDPKAGRRTPAWCDRILSFGKGVKLLSYRRSELKLSDHRPVTAVYDIEVEVFSPRKLQRALTYTDAELEIEDVLIDKGLSAGMNHLQQEEDHQMARWSR